MIENIIKHKFYSSVISDIIKAIQGECFTGAYTLSFCCIDYMGLALNPGKDKNVKSDFIAFVGNYMNKINGNYGKYGDQLYAIRCSLVHSYGPSNSTDKLSFMPHLAFYMPMEFHLWIEAKNNKTTFYLVLADFVSDLIASIALFFNEIQDPKHYEIWEGKLFYDTGMCQVNKRNEIRNTGAFKYGEINPILGIMDEKTDLIAIRKDIYNRLNEIIKPCV